MSLDPSRRVREIFEETLARDPAERESQLDRLCEGDAELRDEVASLLRAHERADVLLDRFENRTSGAASRAGSVPPSPVAERIGPYHVLREAGRGGMGLVYQARDVRLERDVALKFLDTASDTDPDAKARFVVEAKAAAALDHPNIATIYGVDETDDGQLYIAMAYYEGQTLKEMMSGGPVEEDHALRIVAQVASGLEAAHGKGIVHRDIKPANVLMTTGGIAKILDFGIAQMGVERTAPRNVMGTMAYMSPEQIRAAAVDQRSDLWSLGVLFYEMLSGRKPFEGSSAAAMMYSILNEAPSPLPRTGPLHAHLQLILDRALSKDVHRRFQHAADFLADLEAARKGAAAIGRAADNLPEQPTSFVGRSRELDALGELLASTRIATLTGPGGTGKTRLALELASRCRGEFPDGVWFVPLASLTDTALVPSAIARAIGVRETGETPLLESIRDFVRDRQLLLVIDNFEHLIEAAPLVAELLSSSRRLKILVTSRAPLHVSGEHEYPVPPLGLPGADAKVDDPSSSEAVALFVERARAIHGGFTLGEENRAAVTEICMRLDGLPLAIELAAARVKILPPRALLARLTNRLELLTGGARDAPARHHTLRQAIGWSYDLLGKDEKALLRRLAVFFGGFSLDAGEEVGRSGRAPGVDVIADLSSLVDKSLLRQEEQPDGQPRFFMLETIREFASECLVAAGEEAEARRAHAKFFLTFVEAAAPHLRGPDQAVWFERLEREHDNIRRALAGSSSASDGSTGARIAVSMLRFWLVHGHLTEGRKVLEGLLPGSAEPGTELEAALFSGAGTLAHNQGDFAVARAHFERSLAVQRESGDEIGIADVLNHLAWVAWRQGDYQASQSLSEEAQGISRRAGHTRGIATALNNLGWTSHYRGEYREAASSFRSCLELQRSLADERGVGFALTNLGNALHELGEEEAASRLSEAVATLRRLGEKQLYAFALSNLAAVELFRGEGERALSLLCEESLPLFREIGDRWGLAHALAILTDVHRERGELESARAACRESLEMRLEMGDRSGIATCEAKLGDLALLERDDERARSHFQRSLDLRSALPDRAGIGDCLEGLATVAARRGEAERAARLLGASDLLRLESGAPLRGRRAERHQELLALFAEALEPDRLEQALASGRTLTNADAIALASS